MKAIAERIGIPDQHASWAESFPFTRTTKVIPEGAKAVIPHGDELLGTSTVRKLIDDGNYGGPYQVDDAIMDEIFDACVAEVLELIEFKPVLP
jgi:creatinine amidohydrolase